MMNPANIKRAALIGGSGFGDALDSGFKKPGKEIIVENEYGNTSAIIYSLNTNAEIIFMPRHGKGHKIAPHKINHKANISALNSLGVSCIYATSAVGAVNASFSPGDLAVLSDFIDFRGKPETFYDIEGDVRHIDFSEPFDPYLRKTILEDFTASYETHKKNFPKIHSEAVYLCVNGPRYETPAEIKLFASFNTDVVGMTVAPEAILARELGLKYANIAIITNLAAGISPTPLSHEEVEAQMAISRPFVLQSIIGTLKHILLEK